MAVAIGLKMNIYEILRQFIFQYQLTSLARLKTQGYRGVAVFAHCIIGISSQFAYLKVTTCVTQVSVMGMHIAYCLKLS